MFCSNFEENYNRKTKDEASINTKGGSIERVKENF